MKQARTINRKLFRQIQQVVLESPRRVDMDGWVRESRQSDCGTACCIAGWAKVLSYKRVDPNRLKESVLLISSWLHGQDFGVLSEDQGSPSIFHDARRLLGLSSKQAAVLFYSDYWPEVFKRRERKLQAGSKAYAQLVSDVIEGFLACPKTFVAKSTDYSD
jgi:hypothetical protein